MQAEPWTAEGIPRGPGDPVSTKVRGQAYRYMGVSVSAATQVVLEGTVKILELDSFIPQVREEVTCLRRGNLFRNPRLVASWLQFPSWKVDCDQHIGENGVFIHVNNVQI